MDNAGNRTAIRINSVTPTSEGLISDTVQHFINIYLMSGACTVIGSFGTVANTINFLVLGTQGLKDCVSICLMSLAFSDFWTSLLMVVYSVSYALSKSTVVYHLDPISLTFIADWIRCMFFDISVTTTAFISLERCLCVLMPFKFRDLFTFWRSLIVIVVLYIFNIVSYAPIFATFGLSERWDGAYNTTRILLWLSRNRADMEQFSNSFTHIGISSLCQMIVVVSTYTMIKSLRKSDEFRHRGANASVTKNCEKTSRRNRKLVKMTSILAIIFLMSGSVRLCVVYLRRIVPAVSFGNQYHNLYRTLIACDNFCGTTNASVNIFVYSFYKPGFRRTFLEAFCPCYQSLKPEEQANNKHLPTRRLNKTK